MRNFFSNKLIKIELSVILLFFVVYYLMKIQNNDIYFEFLINLIFVLLLIILFIFRDSNIRHMYFAFVFLLFTVTGNFFGLNDFIYITSSLTLSLLILGVINMVLFKDKSLNE